MLEALMAEHGCALSQYLPTAYTLHWSAPMEIKHIKINSTATGTFPQSWPQAGKPARSPSTTKDDISISHRNPEFTSAPAPCLDNSRSHFLHASPSVPVTDQWISHKSTHLPETSRDVGCTWCFARGIYHCTLKKPLHRCKGSQTQSFILPAECSITLTEMLSMQRSVLSNAKHPTGTFASNLFCLTHFP